MPTDDPRTLLGSPPSSSSLREYLQDVSNLAKSTDSINPEVKTYKDAIYMNYYALGLSMMFVGKAGAGPLSPTDITSDNLELDSIDIYNCPPQSGDPQKAAIKSLAKVYTSHPASSITLPLLPVENNDSSSRATEMTITPTSTGKDIVSVLGEPTRKGGGAGPASGSIGIWCDWTKDGIMIEFDAGGPQAWEHGKDTKWKVLTLYRPEKIK